MALRSGYILLLLGTACAALGIAPPGRTEARGSVSGARGAS